MLGVAYGGVAVQPLGFSTEARLLEAGVIAVGGMLPDLDSDSGVPVPCEQVLGLAAAVEPLMFVRRMMHMGLSTEGILASLLFGYVLIRYGAAYLFKWFTGSLAACITASQPCPSPGCAPISRTTSDLPQDSAAHSAFV